MKFVNAKFHFLGIGGIGMSGLAELLHNLGARVTGTDTKENDQVKHLRDIGIRVFIGHRPENIQDSDVIVYSSAIRMDNPEMQEAKRLALPRIPRAEALAEVMNLRRGLAIAGTHGKTTTTSMVASIFIHAEKEPTIAVGGRLDLIKSTALLGKGEWMIAEADESDGSFSKLNPEICIITNIDNDHMDHYGNMEELRRCFYEFGLKIPFYGVIVACGDDPIVRDVFQDFPKKVVFYGFRPDNDYVVSGENGKYSVSDGEGNFIGKMNLQVPGKHNALNALSAVVASFFAGIPFAEGLRGVSLFSGVDRRFQFRGSYQNISVYDDYGHHPTEVRATLQAMQEKFAGKNVYVLFQPHRYSRTSLCWEDFMGSFRDARKVLLLDIYAAGEKPIESVDSVRFAQELKSKNGVYVGNFLQAQKIIDNESNNCDVLLCLGAGDVNKFYNHLQSLT
ncbi:MAG: UDP-N-acetylmuramate--L-alanine ligase [Bdellovibrionaceae bacterium]|nr:UDP-N-acetylmuramate--L-alanine ligase [Pseudobdellovibrionaceae bacterium]